MWLEMETSTLLVKEAACNSKVVILSMRGKENQKLSATAELVELVDIPMSNGLLVTNKGNFDKKGKQRCSCMHKEVG